MSKSIAGKIQAYKKRAQPFRNRDEFKTVTYFHCAGSISTRIRPAGSLMGLKSDNPEGSPFADACSPETAF